MAELFTRDDATFDGIYPPAIRALSELFWTPVAVAAEAARWLAEEAGTRVLDLGCGAGKFCLVGAATTAGHFTGVEQRAELVAAARQAAAGLGLERLEFVHANITDTRLADFDAFYLFNPFEENRHGYRIDSAIPLAPELYQKYTRHVAAELAQQPLGTRVASYMGYAEDIPDCYTCDNALFDDDLKFWVKTRAHDAELERLRLRSPRSYRGARGWAPPRH